MRGGQFVHDAVMVAIRGIGWDLLESADSSAREQRSRMECVRREEPLFVVQGENRGNTCAFRMRSNRST
jgi:hypothetical protein